MFTLSAAVRIYVAAAPCDLRRGCDGLSALTRSVIGTDPMSGHLFVFLNRRRDRIKILLWDRTGFLVVYKRLESGSFSIPVSPRAGQQHVEVDAGELMLMLEGLDLRNARRQPRWYRSPHEPHRTAAVRAV